MSRLRSLALAAAACAATAGGALAQRAAQPASLVLPPGSTVASWSADTDNRRLLPGRLLVAGKPVAGATVTIDGVRLPPTDRNGAFLGAVDATAVQRHLVAVADTADATVGGARLDTAQRDAVAAATGAVDVSYAVKGLSVKRTSAGFVVSGRILRGDGTPAPTVKIFSYRLTGRVVGADGKPVAGAVVSTRTQDRDYWTISEPTDAQGRYVSLFTASDETGRDPVPFSIRVAVGNSLYEYLPDEVVWFTRLQSAVLDLRLPPPGYAMAIPRSTSQPGAVYKGVVVGAALGGRPVRPVSARWPDASGRFELVLPASLAGRTVSLFEAQKPFFSAFRATPGGSFDVADWPTALDPTWPLPVSVALP